MRFFVKGTSDTRSGWRTGGQERQPAVRREMTEVPIARDEGQVMVQAGLTDQRVRQVGAQSLRQNGGSKSCSPLPVAGCHLQHGKLTDERLGVFVRPGAAEEFCQDRRRQDSDTEDQRLLDGTDVSPFASFQVGDERARVERDQGTAVALVFPEPLQVEIEPDLSAQSTEFAVGFARGNEVQALADRLRDPGAARPTGALEKRVRHVNRDLLECFAPVCRSVHGCTVP